MADRDWAGFVRVRGTLGGWVPGPEGANERSQGRSPWVTRSNRNPP